MRYELHRALEVAVPFAISAFIIIVGVSVGLATGITIIWKTIDALGGI